MAEKRPVASPWLRLGAFVLDMVVVACVTWLLVWMTSLHPGLKEGVSRVGAWMPETLLWAVVGVLVMIVVNWRPLGRGQTIGKTMLNLRMVRKNGMLAGRGRIILRRLLPFYLVQQLPVIGGCLALLDVLFIVRKDHNTLHDDLADTKVVDIYQEIVGGEAAPADEASKQGL